MKSLKRIKIIILFVICFIAKINGHSQVKELILNDPDKNLPTNVRNKPGGDVIKTLDSREELVLVKIISKEGNYFLITSYELCGREEIRLPKSGYIHYSVLGGFISKFQLLEIKYFDSSLLLSNKIDFAIDTNVIRKININECDIIELYKHPYIGKELAKRLWEFRKAHYPLTSNKIQMMRSMPIETCVKLNPYLDFRPNTK